ncbi:lipopolysaccharide/colanic/teichoic acid biosynthesis glycosyltransferase [Roseiarcus fermentans]|uniref:Lipopolysaccharide/colanic/teichoic acid biosynthesis glycosyltransferase n=1 Tax=Roseiarcus fermentans TaxID=1473586 RepID=A0A366F061_9HYPH|nr:lipopolysaccharide/colanic/teichoic acid biosynthesis glycosyltransferase [Roseiarcus fermentans]
MPSFQDEVWLYLTFTILSALLVIAVFRLGEGICGFISARDVRAICIAAATATSASSVMTFMVNRLEHIPRSTPFISFLVLSVGWTAVRVVVQQINYSGSRRTRGSGDCQPRRVLLVGIDRFAALAIGLTDCQAARAVQFVAALDARPGLLGRAVNGVKIVGKPGDVQSIIEEYAVHGVEVEEVWISQSLALAANEDRAKVESACQALGVKHTSIAQALNLHPRQSAPPPSIEPRTEAYLIPKYFKVKRVLDIVIAGLLCAPLLPVTVLVAAIVAVDVGWPVIFWQERIGYKGRRFLLYKFRTYRAPYDRSGQPIRRDVRLSRLGGLVRKTRLDEIPQLLNILRGDMSIIGPRPLLLVDQPTGLSIRLMVRPGLTGWAQINGGTQVDVEEKNALDAWYICHASLAFDLQIAIQTLLYFFKGERKSNRAIDEAIGWWRTGGGSPGRRPYGSDAERQNTDGAVQLS